MTTATTDPAVQQIIADAKTAGAQLITDARDATHTLLTHVATEATADVPHVEAAVIGVVTDFIPSSMRVYVTPLLQAATAGSAHAIQAGMQTAIQKALGVALARIDATLATLSHTTA